MAVMNTMETEIEKRRAETDTKIKEILNSIVEKGQHLSLEDKRFLKARYEYLGRAHKQEYAYLLEEDLSVQSEEVSEATITPEEELIFNLQERARVAGVKSPERFKTKKALNDAIASVQLAEGK